MTTHSFIDKRTKNIRKRLEHLTLAIQTPSGLTEIEERLVQVDDLVAAMPSCVEPSGAECHLLEHFPFLTTKILFHLDCCEELLNHLEQAMPGLSEKNATPETFLYPSVGETIVCRLFTVLIHLRARLFGYEVNPESPTLREILYLKSPFWLEPFLRRLLPKRRPKWSCCTEEKSHYSSFVDK